MNITQKYLKDSFSLIGDSPIDLRPMLVLNDGFEMSVQASSAHYCSPKADLEDGMYRSVEVGFPNKEEPLLLPYSEDSTNHREVYANVPVVIIDEIIKKHGGIKKKEEFDMENFINIELFKDVYEFLYTDEDKKFHQPAYPLLEMQYDILRFQERIGQLMDKEFHEGFCIDRPESEGGNQYSPLFQVYHKEFVRLDELANQFMEEVVKPFNHEESNIRHDYYHGIR